MTCLEKDFPQIKEIQSKLDELYADMQKRREANEKVVLEHREVAKERTRRGIKDRLSNILEVLTYQVNTHQSWVDQTVPISLYGTTEDPSEGE